LMEILVDDPRRADVRDLLRAHLEGVAAHSPPESIHALGIEGLCDPAVTFWTARENGVLLGCGALKHLEDSDEGGHGEVKSMRTSDAHLRRGVASAILRVMIDEARRRGWSRLSLETGSQAGFEPARVLYTRFGFEPCGPFGEYRDDPNSVFMTMRLG